MSNWSIPFDQLAAKAQLDIETVVRRSTLQLFKNVIDLSPVAYPPNWKKPVKGYVGGRFRGNWFPSHGVILKQVNEHAKANDSYARLEKIYQFPVGGVVFLTNNVPYATRLENGWSAQAPLGVVRKSAIQFRRIVRQIIRE